MDEKKGVRLKGLKSICAHAGWSEKVVRQEIDDHGFPACLEHGVWVSYTDLIDAWLRKKFEKKHSKPGTMLEQKRKSNASLSLLL